MLWETNKHGQTSDAVNISESECEDSESDCEECAVVESIVPVDPSEFEECTVVESIVPATTTVILSDDEPEIDPMQSDNPRLAALLRNAIEPELPPPITQTDLDCLLAETDLDPDSDAELTTTKPAETVPQETSLVPVVPAETAGPTIKPVEWNRLNGVLKSKRGKKKTQKHPIPVVKKTSGKCGRMAL